MILTLAEAGYRSLRDLVLPLERLNVITGPNGSGKSSFYRALRLVGALATSDNCRVFTLEKQLGETVAPGMEVPAWDWPKR